MKTILPLKILVIFFIIIEFFVEKFKGNKKIKKNKFQSITNDNSVPERDTNDQINDVFEINNNNNDNNNNNNDFVFEKRVENNQSPSKKRCNLDKDCKECPISGFHVRCHENLCFCCGSDKKCYCQK